MNCHAPHVVHWPEFGPDQVQGSRFKKTNTTIQVQVQESTLAQVQVLCDSLASPTSARQRRYCTVT
jgi:hypothetical protein